MAELKQTQLDTVVDELATKNLQLDRQLEISLGRLSIKPSDFFMLRHLVAHLNPKDIERECYKLEHCLPLVQKEQKTATTKKTVNPDDFKGCLLIRA